jgi:hypothetical protein
VKYSGMRKFVTLWLTILLVAACLTTVNAVAGNDQSQIQDEGQNGEKQSEPDSQGQPTIESLDSADGTQAPDVGQNSEELPSQDQPQ